MLPQMRGVFHSAEWPPLSTAEECLDCSLPVLFV